MQSKDIRARWAPFDKARIQRLAKEGGWVIAGQVAAGLGALALVRVLTEYLTPAQYGELALGLTVAGLVNQVVMGGLTAGIGRFYSIAAEKNDLTGYLQTSRRLMSYATAVVMAIAAVLLVGLSSLGYSQWMGLAFVAVIFSILSGYGASLSGIQNATRQRALVAFHSALDAWLKILLSVGVMLWLGSSSTTAVIGYALSSLLVTGSQLFLLQKGGPYAPREVGERDWGRQIWAYSWPFSIFGLFTWLHQASDRWVLQTFSTTEDVGFYAVVFQLGYMPIGLATGMAMNFLGPILYQRSGGANELSRNTAVHRLAWRITWACFGLMALAFVFTLSLHELIFKILVAEEYQLLSHLLPWMVAAGGIFAAGQMLALKLMADMTTSVLMTAKIVTALLGIIMNISCAMAFGVEGVVMAQVSFSLIYFLWMMWLAQHPKKARHG